jgi:peptide/nickel transport system permease protein
MARFIARRLLWAVPVLFGAVTLSFLIVRLIPGNPVQDMLAGQPSQPALERALTNQFHLNKPVIEQYALYLGSVVRGNFGLSLTTGGSVVSAVGSVIVSTLELTGLATLMGLLLGAIGGIGTSWVRSKRVDRGLAAFQMVAVSLPTFWLALLLLTLFSFNLHWFPATGNAGFESLVLPALALGLPVGAVISQLLRSGMLEVLREPFIITARAKGMSEWRVRLGHAFRNAVLPSLNYIGVIFGTLITGAVVAEAVFSRQGLGRMVVTAVTNKDYPLVQGIVILIALAYVLINIAVDLIHAGLDPRIRE